MFDGIDAEAVRIVRKLVRRYPDFPPRDRIVVLNAVLKLALTLDPAGMILPASFESGDAD